MNHQQLTSIGFLTGKAHGLIKARAQTYLEQHHVPLRMELFPLLNTLRQQDHISQQAVAEILGIDRHRISRMVDELEKLGWVARLAHPENRRENLVALTSMAKDMFGAIDQALSMAVEDALHGLSPQQRQQTVQALIKIIQNLR